MREKAKRLLIIPAALVVASLTSAGTCGGDEKPECFCETPDDYDSGMPRDAGLDVTIADGGCAPPTVERCYV